MDRARRLLTENKLSVRQLARALGISSGSAAKVRLEVLRAARWCQTAMLPFRAGMAKRKKAPNDLGDKIATLRKALRAALGVKNPPIIEAMAFCSRFHDMHKRPASLAEIVAHLRAKEEERRAASRTRSSP